MVQSTTLDFEAILRDVYDPDNNALKTTGGVSPGEGSSGFTEGSVIFADSAGNLNENNLGIFWNDTTKRLEFGDGTTRDANLYRSAADTLKTDDSFVVGGPSATAPRYTFTNGQTAQVVDSFPHVFATQGGGAFPFDQFGHLIFQARRSDGNREIIFLSANGTVTLRSGPGTFALFGKAPVTQRAHIADPSGGITADAEARDAIDAILVVLEELGITAAA